MITDRLNKVIEKYKITKTENIIYGTNIPMPKAVIPTPFKTYIKLDKTEYYFFYFDKDGITIYLRDGEGYATIPWTDITNFKISKFLIIGKMTIKTNDYTYKFQLNRKVVGCPWITKNTKNLEEHNYFNPKSKN